MNINKLFNKIKVVKYVKVYISNRKIGENYEQALSVYSKRGKLIYSDFCKIRSDSNLKFDKGLQAILWGIKRFRSLCQNGFFSESEPVMLFINSQTIYHWLETEVCPKNYLDIFSEIQMEISLIVNDLEIIYSKETKALFKTTQKKNENVKHFMKAFKDFED